MDKIKVLIVDDQTLMRDGLKTILEYQQDIEVAGTAANGLEALRLVDEKEIDVVLMDIRMEIMNGVEATKHIKEKYPDVAVLILTTFNDEEYIKECLGHKASGYLLKDIEGQRLVEAIRYAHKGNFIMPSQVAEKLTKLLNADDESSESRIKQQSNIHFSELEKSIIALMVEGCSNKQIAALLHISYGTAKNYVSQIYDKIGEHERVKAVALLRNMID